MRKFVLFIVALLFSFGAISQSLTPEVVASAGDYFENEYGSLSWTLGEPIIETFANDEIILTQGFQQTYYQVVAVQDLETDSYDVNIYPIPAKDFINIEITSQDVETNLNLQLFDVMGNVVYDKIVVNTNFKEKLYLTGYQTNMFFLKVTNLTNKQVKSFKILKVRF